MANQYHVNNNSSSGASSRCSVLPWVTATLVSVVLSDGKELGTGWMMTFLIAVFQRETHSTMSQRRLSPFKRTVTDTSWSLSSLRACLQGTSPVEELRVLFNGANRLHFLHHLSVPLNTLTLFLAELHIFVSFCSLSL